MVKVVLKRSWRWWSPVVPPARRLRGDGRRDARLHRHARTPDEIWLCEHRRSTPRGLAGRPSVLACARHSGGGGQPRRAGHVPRARAGRRYPAGGPEAPEHLRPREYVFQLERALLRRFEAYGVTGHRVLNAPGIYGVALGDPFGHAAAVRAREHRTRSPGSARSPPSASGHAPLHLPRGGAERGDGSRPFDGINPWVRRAQDDIAKIEVSPDRIGTAARKLAATSALTRHLAARPP